MLEKNFAALLSNALADVHLLPRDGNLLGDPKGKRLWLHPTAESNGLSGYGLCQDPGRVLGNCMGDKPMISLNLIDKLGRTKDGGMESEQTEGTPSKPESGLTTATNTEPNMCDSPMLVGEPLNPQTRRLLFLFSMEKSPRMPLKKCSKVSLVPFAFVERCNSSPASLPVSLPVVHQQPKPTQKRKNTCQIGKFHSSLHTMKAVPACLHHHHRVRLEENFLLDSPHPQIAVSPSLVSQPKPSSAATHMDLSGAPLFRVCRSDDPTLGPLFHPCRCTGSIAHVHDDCLSTWLSFQKIILRTVRPSLQL
ncbi:hypothetical protein PCANC_02213 [Puccinia coronata f. sp. avenae]|uniref:RING-type E3 ubiquitin transferase n=1 Tax=Puccinia coronata f. sp. avenae TaxID=200324 RepID=A0A2N5W0X1_9BASI|nr:hypothetical protein PCASD_26008 [Puccinia coronata f. sp. avenae]PLW55901.1 hypothetical protein PCANC_02213 [Puccinia coronata f. sp. avenae]